jgi:hypothetical protein
MKIKELLKEIKGVFKPPKKSYYFGKLYYGTPYMYPINFCSTIIKVRKLKLKSNEEILNELKKWIKPSKYQINNAKFSNLPMVRRNKEWIKKIFGNYYLIQIGYPIMFKQVELGWKWKYSSLRYEWSPSFQIYFFNWQFCIFWNAPDGNNDLYYEQILWWLEGSKKNLEKAKETWEWKSFKTKKSTWNDNYLEWEHRDIYLGL